MPPRCRRSGGLRSGFGGAPTLSMGDYRAIGKELAAVRYASPSVRTSAPVVFGNQNWSTIVMGVTPEFFNIREWGVSSGRIFGAEDVESSAKVCLLGQTVASYLFGDENPLGKIVRIKRVPFVVAGVLGKQFHAALEQRQGQSIYIAQVGVAGRGFATLEHQGIAHQQTNPAIFRAPADLFLTKVVQRVDDGLDLSGIGSRNWLR